jgi:cation:H+ antiporter
MKFFSNVNENSEKLRENNYSDIMKPLIFIVIGITLLSFGADVFIEGASGIAELWGVNSATIGLTLVALGTSIPELFVTINAAIKKEYDFVIGNVIGSNILNIVFVGGVSSLFSNFVFKSSEFYVSNIILICITFSLLFLVFQRAFINRFLGSIFIIIYFIFLYINFIGEFSQT